MGEGGLLRRGVATTTITNGRRRLGGDRAGGADDVRGGGDKATGRGGGSLQRTHGRVV
jgi:hypothetical protein